MERYETAIIEVEQFDEDVITASVIRCEPRMGIDGSHYEIIEGWDIYYSDGTCDLLEGTGDQEMPKPEVCP